MARQSSFFHAKQMAMSIKDEEAQKNSLIEERKTDMTEQVEQMIIGESFGMVKPAAELEFFKDNAQVLKGENKKIEKALKAEQ